MTDEDVARLIQIARNPNPALTGVADVKDLVDGISGPTKKEFKDFVVEKAALTSWRVAMLTAETRRILQGAPLSLDQKRLESLLGQVKSHASKLKPSLIISNQPRVRNFLFKHFSSWFKAISVR